MIALPSAHILGGAAVVIGLLGYLPYFYSLWRGQTRPHVFSWFIWGLLTGIAFFAQHTAGAGAGGWVTGFTAVICLLIAAVALKRGEKTITRSDWASFIVALLCLPLWHYTTDAFYAIVLISAIDALGFWPTFRKSWDKPYEEQPLTYIASLLKFVVALFALQSLNWTSALYPVSIVLLNGLFIVMIYTRRHMLKTPLTAA